MSLLNLTARASTVTLRKPDNSSPLDLSNLLVGLVVSNSRLDESGLIKTTGRLTLSGTRPPGFAESLDVRVNPSRWARGARLEVTTDGNPHPRGKLRILQVPAPPPLDGGEFEIEVGCQLALLDSPDAPETNDDLVIPPIGGNPGEISRTEAINYLAAKIGLPNLLDEIVEYPLSIMPRRTEGSVVQQMGQIAYAAGYVLWIDALDRLRATRIDPEAAYSFSYSALLDAVSFEMRQGEENSAEQVSVAATTLRLASLQMRRNELFIFDSDSYREIIKTEIPEEGDPIKVESLKPLRLVFPGLFPGNDTLVTVSRQFRFTRYYPDGLLDTEEEHEFAPAGLTLPALFPGDTTLMPARLTLRSTYYKDEAVEIISEETYEPYALVFPGEPAALLDPFRQTLSKTNWRKWSPYRDGWLEETTSLDIVTGESTADARWSDTQVTPPAPQRKSPDFQEQETPVLETTEFDQAGVTPGLLGRKRTYRLRGTLSQPEQAKELSERLGKLLFGRTQPVTWVCPIPQSMLTSYAPLRVWRWSDPEVTAHYLADGDTFALTTSESTFAADGLYLGSEDEGGELRRPYQVRMKARLRAVAAATGDLSCTEPAMLLGVVNLSAAATGDLSFTPSLAGSLSALAPATGDLTFTPSLEGTLSALAPATGDLTFSVAVNLEFSSFGDTNGLFYWLGTDGHSVSWSNPFNTQYTAPLLGFSSPTITNSAARISDRETSTAGIIVAASVAGSGNFGLRIDLGSRRMRPTLVTHRVPQSYNPGSTEENDYSARILLWGTNTDHDPPNPFDANALGGTDFGSYSAGQWISFACSESNPQAYRYLWISPASPRANEYDFGFVLDELEIYGFLIP